MSREHLPLSPSMAFSFRAARRRLPGRRLPWRVTMMRRVLRAVAQGMAAIKRSVPSRMRNA